VHQGESLREKPAKNPISYVGRIPQTLEKLTKRNVDFNHIGLGLTRRRHVPNQISIHSLSRLFHISKKKPHTRLPPHLEHDAKTFSSEAKVKLK